MPAAITSAVFTWLHLLYTIAFICILSPCYAYSLSPFAPAFSGLSTRHQSPQHFVQTPVGASDLRGLGAGGKEAGSQLLGEGER